jgi:hypothetical protein
MLHAFAAPAPSPSPPRFLVNLEDPSAMLICDQNFVLVTNSWKVQFR